VADWLLAHQARLQTDLLLASFAVVAVWESFAARRSLRTGLGPRWLSNLALAALGFAVSALCLPVAAVTFALLAEQRGWGLLNRVTAPLWVLCALGMIVVDLANYAKHRLFHAVPFLWRFHRIHHSDLDMDCGTAVRHHPVEVIAGFGLDLAAICAFGISPLAVFLAATLTGVASVFNHGNVPMPDVTERWLRRLVVTPDMHRVHHSALMVESNSNFAMLLPYWDHLFATYRGQPILGHEGMELGIAEAPATRDVALLRLLALPFRPVRALNLGEASRTPTG
jgi:sterol desaturase/sphingolipid hydroxylase (fatty acid hydroxylase superfamily)